MTQTPMPPQVTDVDLLDPELTRGWQALALQWAVEPPFQVHVHGLPMLVCGRYDDVREVLLDRDRFTAAPPGGPVAMDLFMGLPQLNAMDGDPHDRLRRLLGPFFGPEGTAPLAGAIERYVDELLDGVQEAGGTFEAMADVAEPLVERTLLEALFGVGAEERAQFIAYSNVMGLSLMATPETGYPPAFVTEFERTTALIERLFEDRRGAEGGDFITGLVAARDEGFPVTHEEMVGNTLAVYAGAQLATATSVAVLLMNLARHPEALAAIREDPQMAGPVVEESLRHDPAGLFGFPRFARTDTQVGGVAVAAGTIIQVGLASGNLDPERYPDPSRFDAGRRPRGVLSFSTGAHACIGARVARMILVGVATGAAQRFAELRLADPAFTPDYGGVFGELKPEVVPLQAA